MSVLPNPENLWLFVAFIAALLVLACLRAIGHAYYNAVLWHNLKVEVQNLQIEQKRRLKELEQAGEAPQPRRRRPRRAARRTDTAAVADTAAAPAAEEAPAEAIEVAPAEGAPQETAPEPAEAAA
jgi:cell wall-associated NlpC family hydrolase